MEKPIIRAVVKKLRHLSNPRLQQDGYDAVPAYMEFSGYAIGLPEVGKRFTLLKINADKEVYIEISTSRLKCVYHHEQDASGSDRLVLPSGFPDAELLDWPSDVIRKGDYLIASLNSVYWVHHVEEIPLYALQSS